MARYFFRFFTENNIAQQSIFNTDAKWLKGNCLWGHGAIVKKDVWLLLSYWGMKHSSNKCVTVELELGHCKYAFNGLFIPPECVFF